MPLPLSYDGSQKTKEIALKDIDIIRDMQRYNLPIEFNSIPRRNDYLDNACCRLSSYDLIGNKLKLTFSETTYGDYIRSGEHLDDPHLGQLDITYRKLFADLVRNGQHNLRDLKLTNIAGVGILIITNDNYIVVSRHRTESHVYPGRFTFASSGVMKWGVYPNPFTEIIRKSHDEAHHQVNLDKLRLIGFGADARKLYFQFSFVDRTEVSSEDIKDIIKQSSIVHELHFIPFEPHVVVKQLVENCWEPAAEAALLTLAIKKFTQDRIINELIKVKNKWAMRKMMDEWDFRAGQPGLRSVMSVRYPENEIEHASAQYIEATMDFIGNNIDDKRVLEVGCGIGRMTKPLLDKAKELTSIDLCNRMIERAKAQLVLSNDLNDRIKFECCFAENYMTTVVYDAAICSLILIHNTEYNQFSRLIEVVCKNAKVVFVFEDITKNRPTSPHTRLRSSNEIIEEFKRNNYSLERMKTDFTAFLISISYL